MRSPLATLAARQFKGTNGMVVRRRAPTCFVSMFFDHNEKTSRPPSRSDCWAVSIVYSVESSW